MEHIKILFIVPSLAGGGAEKVILTLVDNIDKSKFKPVLVVINKVGERSTYTNDEVEIIDLKTHNVRKSIFKIINLLKKKKPDIVFSTLNHLNLLMAIISILFPKTKFICRQTREASSSIGNGKLLKFVTTKLMYLLNLHDKIISQSIAMSNNLKVTCKIKEEKIQIINNPVDIDEINLKKNEVCNFFDKSKVNLISSGRLVAAKGFDRMLRVFSLLDKEKYTLTILGDGVNKESLLQLSNELGVMDNVKFLGFKKNPYKYIYNADMFLITSYSEGFSNAVIEALACGKYVIGFSFFGDEIIRNGINGDILLNNSIEEFSQLIEKNTQKKRDKQKITRTIEKLRLSNIMKEYESIFLKCS